MRPSWLLLVSSAFALSCVTIPDVEDCTVAGTIQAGAMCATSVSGRTRDMTLDEFLDFLEPKEGDAPRAGAICRSADDHLKEKQALEEACRLLGKRCKLVPVPQGRRGTFPQAREPADAAGN